MKHNDDKQPRLAMDLPPREIPFDKDITLDDKRQFFKPQDVAHMLSVSNEHVRHLLECGKLESVLIGESDDPERKRVRVTRRSLNIFINNRRHNA